MSIDTSELPFGAEPQSGLVTAGQPSESNLDQLAQAGVKSIVTLRPPSEDAGYDEAAAATRLGMNFTVIPVAGPGDLNLDNAKLLDSALEAAGDAPVLVHCASSNRVGALLALRAAWIHQQSSDDALALGRAGGLTKMEPVVAALLQRGPEA